MPRLALGYNSFHVTASSCQEHRILDQKWLELSRFHALEWQCHEPQLLEALHLAQPMCLLRLGYTKVRIPFLQKEGYR